MAVQAHYPTNVFLPDFSTRSKNNLEELQWQLQEQQSLNPLRGYNNCIQQGFNGTNVISGPESELTCNGSLSRKRNIGELQQQEQNRMNQSGKTSTSGRSNAVNAPFPSLFRQDLATILFQQNLEIDTLLKLQNEKLRLGLEENRKKHCRTFISVLAQQIHNKIREKELELETMNQRNTELLQKVNKMSMENELWQRLAMKNEAIAINLKTTLEQALKNSTEGYGETNGVENDSESCCYETNHTQDHGDRKTCRVCRKNQVSVLLLPCRHLCLCKDCESGLDCCPLCHSAKNASLQIFMS